MPCAITVASKGPNETVRAIIGEMVEKPLERGAL
jgi:hypothetical protein